MVMENSNIADPTKENLGYALLEQKVAVAFRGRRYAYIVVSGRTAGRPWTVGIAVDGERGFNSLSGPGLDFAHRSEADTFAAGMNKHIGLSAREASDILISSMRG